MTTRETIGPGRRSIAQRMRSMFGRFARNRDGATAIEFTALALPFSLLVFAILESCISFAAQEVMANATDDVARQLRTGQLRAANITEASLKKLICDRLDIVVAKDCTTNLSVDLRSYDTFAKFAESKFQIDGEQIVMTGRDPQFMVKPGLSLSKNMLRVFYKWPVITDFMSAAMANLGKNKTLHFATTTWQNEPFDD